MSVFSGSQNHEIAPISTEDFTMPHDLAAESSVLGAMLISPNACATALSMLRPTDFYLPLHESLFAIMETMFAVGQPIDAVSVRASANLQGLNIQIQNGSYLIRLMSMPASTTNVDYYADIVRGKATLRRIAETSLRGFHTATSVQTDYKTAPGEILTNIITAATSHIAEESVSAGGAVDEALQSTDRRRNKDYHPLLTGYPDLDYYLKEISDGQLVLIAARPSTGKSVALLDIARHAAITCQRPTLLFSMEMSAAEIGFRLLAAQSGVSLNSIRDGKLTESQHDLVSIAHETIRASPLEIDTNPSLTIADIRARATRHKHKKGLDLILVDYLGLITPGIARRDRYVEVGEISRGLKILAKDIAPVVAAAQLNRNSEHRPDKKPALADLRDSGSLEQDSDVVLLLHREDMYDPATLRAGEVDIIVAKNRSGGCGVVTLAAQLDKARFVSMYSGM